MTSLLHGHPPKLSGTLSIQFYGGIALLFVGLFLLYVLFDQARKRFKRKRVIDPRVVSQKTGQIACRVRLRLYVSGRGRGGGWRPTAARSLPGSWTWPGTV